LTPAVELTVSSRAEAVTIDEEGLAEALDAAFLAPRVETAENAESDSGGGESFEVS
jgi:hypothetical protein